MNNTTQKIFSVLYSFKRTIAIVVFVAVLLAIPLTLALNQQTQTLQQQAAEATPTPNVPSETNFVAPDQVLELDVNQDGTVDVTDYNILLRCTSTPSECEILNPQDLNGDGSINQQDYQILIERFLNLQPLQ